MNVSAEASANVALSALDDLWFQISGTLCNLTCQHCFISCSPTNHAFEPISRETVLKTLEESRVLGVKEYYFTGGEPFIHPDMVEILERTLELGPATVLTNGTLLKPPAIARLAIAEAGSLYSLEFRVSIDGYTPESNDRIRGRGSFARAMAGVRLLLEQGFLPIVTVAQTWEDGRTDEVLARFVEVLKAEGYARPRVKLIPTLRLGAEVERSHGYHDSERVTASMLEDFDPSALVCAHSRMVTDRGVYVCPILIDAPEERMGDHLGDALGPSKLDHGACYTCYLSGAICSNTNVSAGGGDVS